LQNLLQHLWAHTHRRFQMLSSVCYSHPSSRQPCIVHQTQ
jgi:hypothetical protein